MSTKTYKAPHKRGGESGPVTNIRIVLSGTKQKEITSFCNSLVQKSRDLQISSVRGPRRMPTKKLSITTRKSPCGNGTASWERWEMRIHKRVIDIQTSEKTLVELIRIKMDPSIEIQVFKV